MKIQKVSKSVSLSRVQWRQLVHTERFTRAATAGSTKAAQELFCEPFSRSDMYIRREREFFNERAHHTGPVEEQHARVWVSLAGFMRGSVWKRATAFAMWRATGNGATGNIISSLCPSRGWIFSWTTMGGGTVSWTVITLSSRATIFLGNQRCLEGRRGPCLFESFLQFLLGYH